MRSFQRAVLLVGLLLAASFLTGRTPSPARAGEPVAVELFVRPGCPHCERAEAFLDALLSRRPRLELQRFDVSDPDALARLQRHAETTGTAAVGVPAVLVDGTLFIGFDDAETTGRAIEAAILRAAASASAVLPAPGPSCPMRENGPCDPVPEPGNDEADRVQLPVLGVVRPQDVGLPLFTIALGLVDGFNPCAMWVLLYLLAILVHVRSRSRMLLIAATFVAVSGFVYFAFMAAWLNAFGLMGAYRPVQVVLGTLAIGVAALNLKDFVVPGVGPSLSIPENRKPGLYARVRRIVQAESVVVSLVLVSGLALAVNMVELMCTAGLPAIYTHVLSLHELPAAERYGYLVLYNLAYVFDDSVMVGVAVTTLSRTKLQERGGRLLKLLSGVVILALGLLLLFAPERLSWG